jgi:hypothetical protein
MMPDNDDLREDYHYFGEESAPVDAARGAGAPRGEGRFHGAFTGGFSAGYQNTVGSAYGWQPSKDKNRKQSVEDFLDDDELDEYMGTVLQAKSQFDTYGLAARDAVSRDLKRAVDETPHMLVVPSVMITPVVQGIGVRMLLKMGWRQGKGLKFNQELCKLMDQAQTLEDIQQISGTSILEIHDVDVQKIDPKRDTFGLGYDPFRGAEEFRSLRQRQKLPTRPDAGISRRNPGIAFGTGIIEDDGDWGILEDYVTHDAFSEGKQHQDLLDHHGKPLLRHDGLARDRLGDKLMREGYTFEIQDVEDDGLMLPGGSDAVLPLPDTSSHPSCSSILPGFVTGYDDVQPLEYPRPRIDRGFSPCIPSWVKHKAQLAGRTIPKPAREPEGHTKQRIDQLALQVARSGSEFELIALECGEDSTLIAPGSEYHDYYLWKVKWFLDVIHRHQENKSRQLSAGERSDILGERKLEQDRKKMQERLASKFVSAGSVTETKGRPGTSGSISGKVVTILDLSRPPKFDQNSANRTITRTFGTWEPEALLCKRLGIEPSVRLPRPPREHTQQDRRTREGDDKRLKIEDKDATAAASEFLDQLLAETGPSNELPGLQLERPIELFRAIFEEQDPRSYQEREHNDYDVFKPVVLSETEPKHARKVNEETMTRKQHESKPSPSVPVRQVDTDRAPLDDDRIREALRVLEKERKRKHRKDKKINTRKAKKRHHRKDGSYED